MKELIPEELVHEITSQCRTEHQELFNQANEEHLRKMKRAMRYWVTFPVGILSAIFVAFLVMTNTSAVRSAEHRIATEKSLESQNEKIDTQTLNIGIESKQRELTDIEIRNEIRRLEKKWDENWKWLIENGNFKYRGENPLLK
jgi:hypothetical protein